MSKPIYVLGTNLSHDGSACLLKDGEICVAIEKERITRKKHDGMNDTAAIQYCLNAAGITINEVDLVVQNALYGGSFDYGNGSFKGPRIFTDDVKVPVVTISHHLAHAYSTIGTSPFEGDFNVLVIDGSGSPFCECMDLEGAFIPDNEKIHADVSHLYFEKDSFYTYQNGCLTPVIKDFSPYGVFYKNAPVAPYTMHSLGSAYQAISHYCFRNMSDVGKLMGLAPYGNPGVIKEDIFHLRGGRVFINYDLMKSLNRPAGTHSEFKRNFTYYANIAYKMQEEIERAILYLVEDRLNRGVGNKLCYAGGVALNAVANNLILKNTRVGDLYIQPAAGDNGIAIGCAYYGWLEVMKRERKIKASRSTCFGQTYSQEEVKKAIYSYSNTHHRDNIRTRIDNFFRLIKQHAATGKAKGAVSLIEFNISDYCRYQLKVSDSGVYIEVDGEGRADCIVNIDAHQLGAVIMDPLYSGILLDAGNVQVSHPPSIGLLGKVVDLGKVFGNKELFNGTLHRSIIEQVIYSDNYIKQAAQLLAAGKVIGWFQGGAEFGPRALGRRSILADPRNSGVRDYINTEIKFREDFRPFAPAVLREDVGTYFMTDRESPYMILVDDVKPEWHQQIQSIVHRNNTSRIQTVTADWSPEFYQLLVEFKALTGISLLLNTSLNKRGMPIVETPAEALDFFHSCKLDHLVIGNYIVGKELPPENNGPANHLLAVNSSISE
ncbi:carbamoyltransferase family protein [Chitinophaga sp. ARDCPP14]|uniref:carbamoyltransferase family protein n=1 Tax=Chitinophaga sp. ARDCPP14 TaxID=3391139 RepID=UPI003F51E6BD